MQNVMTRLTEWRLAERHLASLPVGSPEWDLAAEDVERTHAAYRAEVAQATARVHETELAAERRWWTRALGAAMSPTTPALHAH
jgi:hypothetical protein